MSTLLLQVYLEKKLNNRNKPWIDIFLAIQGKDFICTFFDFGEGFFLNTLKQEKNIWRDVLSCVYASLKIDTMKIS